MKKEIYSKPKIKVHGIGSQNILSASNSSNLSITPSNGTINSGRVDAKPYTFFDDMGDNVEDDNNSNAISWN